ncbi:MAG: cardiolipin synthase [Coriobacteriales bacterium]|nr:cardiolipin synthase [Coriobacteriales bacterium]
MSLYVLGWIGVGALLVYWVAVFIFIVMDNKEPEQSLAWLVLLFMLPFLGGLLYFLFGRDWRAPMNSKWRQGAEFIQPAMTPIYQRYRPLAEALVEKHENTVVPEVVSCIHEQNEAWPLPVKSFDLYPHGSLYFGAMLEDMRNAERFIHHLYFIWERDELTAEMTEIMLDKLKQGVEVRIIYDWLGSSGFKKSELKKLAAAGAGVYADFKRLNSVNYRNHRKITVIDAEIGYTGGFNVGQEYIDGGKDYPAWRDTGCRFTGPGVAELEKWFSQRWFANTGEQLMSDEYLPAAAPELLTGDPVLIQVVAQSNDDPWWSSRRAHQIAIGSARKTLRICSPYYVPSVSLYDSMVNAALAGVDVQFMMTGWPDHKSAWEAAKSYFEPLLHAGAHIYMYEKGFFHAKTMAVDSLACAIGTMNLDRRSLFLQNEMMTWVYSPEVALELERVFEEDKADCREITLEEVEAYTFGQRLVQRSSRLLADVL